MNQYDTLFSSGNIYIFAGSKQGRALSEEAQQEIMHKQDEAFLGLPMDGFPVAAGHELLIIPLTYEIEDGNVKLSMDGNPITRSGDITAVQLLDEYKQENGHWPAILVYEGDLVLIQPEAYHGRATVISSIKDDLTERQQNNFKQRLEDAEDILQEDLDLSKFKAYTEKPGDALLKILKG